MNGLVLIRVESLGGQGYGPFCTDCADVLVEANNHIDCDVEDYDGERGTCKRCDHQGLGTKAGTV